MPLQTDAEIVAEIKGYIDAHRHSVNARQRPPSLQTYARSRHYSADRLLNFMNGYERGHLFDSLSYERQQYIVRNLRIEARRPLKMPPAPQSAPVQARPNAAPVAHPYQAAAGGSLANWNGQYGAAPGGAAPAAPPQPASRRRMVVPEGSSLADWDGQRGRSLWTQAPQYPAPGQSAPVYPAPGYPAPAYVPQPPPGAPVPGSSSLSNWDGRYGTVPDVRLAAQTHPVPGYPAPGYPQQPPPGAPAPGSSSLSNWDGRYGQNPFGGGQTRS